MKLEIHPENKDFSWSIPEGPYKFLSNKQAQQFNTDGYLIIKDAFDIKLIIRVI